MSSKEFQLKNFEIVAILVILLVSFVLLLKVAVPNHIVFGDEGFHVRIAEKMAETKEYPTWIGTNLEKTGFSRTPAFHILQAGFLSLLGYNELAAKVLTPFIAVMTGLGVFLLTKKLYNKEIGFLSAVLLVALPSFVTYSVFFYTDMLFVFYATMALLLFLLSIKENNVKYWFLSSVFFALAFLTKIVGLIFLIFIPIAFVYMMFRMKEWSRIQIFRKYFLFGIIFLILISPFFIRNVYYYHTPLCDLRLGGLLDRSGCSINNFTPQYEFPARSGEGPGTENSLLRFGLVNFANFAYGSWSTAEDQFFVFKILTAFGDQFTKITGLSLTSLFFLVGVFGGIVILASKRDHVNVLLLIMLSLMTVILSQSTHRTEDTAREILFWAPLLAITSAVYWAEIQKSLSRLYKYLGLVFVIFILLIGFQGLTTKLDSLVPVKQFSPMFFQACDWVKENLPSDSMLMTFWGYRAGYNCQRDVSPAFADIRLSDDAEYINSVSHQHGITHFFIQKFSISQDASRESYSIAFVQLLENNPQYFEKVYENGLSLPECLSAGGCDGNIIYKVV